MIPAGDRDLHEERRALEIINMGINIKYRIKSINGYV